MPELPDIELYVTRLSERLVGTKLLSMRVFSPFVLRSVGPPPSELSGLAAVSVGRIGKRLVIELENEKFVVIHLMIAGRLQWQSPAPPDKKAFGKVLLASWTFEQGRLSLVEMSQKKRASIHLLQGRKALDEVSRGGLNVFASTPESFRASLTSSNRTLKRALTNPAAFDGIGNAYSDEILFHARLSPVRLTQALSDEEVERLRLACIETLGSWRERLLEIVPSFPRPADVTAFRPDFCVHGRFAQPCRVCAAPIQHIVYAENETNYCANCQNEGRLLADRSLSRLLKSDWPKTLEAMLEGQAT